MATRGRATPQSREQELTVDQVRQALDYDPVTGLFTWKYRADMPPSWNGRWPGRVAGSKSASGYLTVRLAYEKFQAHRLAWLATFGERPPQVIDHINGNKEDNRICNLRLATQNENMQNRGKETRNTSGLKGASWDKTRQKWQSIIGYNGRYYNLGRYDTAQEAHDAYCKAAQRLHGSFARFD